MGKITNIMHIIATVGTAIRIHHTVQMQRSEVVLGQNLEIHLLGGYQTTVEKDMIVEQIMRLMKD